jgi:type 1 glutamine amidotransferase
MKKITLLAIVCTIFMMVHPAIAQGVKEFELEPAWKEKIRGLAPVHPTVIPYDVPKILVFNLSTGFQHWAVPHTAAMMEVLSDKTGAFVMEQSSDIGVFEDLSGYDAVLLNNNCSERERRDLFWDELGKDPNLPEKGREKKAASLEKNLIRFVKRGGGLMVVHGGIVMQNNSMEFSRMVGGSFDYHPAQQEIKVDLVEPGHPLVSCFEGESFVHVDEPYIFRNAYFDYEFRPLLSMDVSSLPPLRKETEDKVIYISWIKRYGKGRVFYVSPSHNAQTFENPRMLKFFLDGLQYVTGDLACDDTPRKP